MSFNVGIEVLHDEEFVVAVYQIVKQALEVAIGTVSHLIHNLADIGIGVILIPCTVAAMLVEVDNFLGAHAEDYAVVIANLLVNLNICTVHSTQGDGTVHHELHVAGTGCLLGSSGNLLADISSRIYHLTQGYTEVLQEDNLDLAVDARVGVNLVGNSQNQADGLLGNEVARCGLATEEVNNRYRHVVGRVILQAVILIHDMHDIHQLTLVGMNALYLHIKHGVNLDADLVVSQHILSQGTLSGTLYLIDGLQESRVVHILVQLLHHPGVASPGPGQLVVNNVCQVVVGTDHPAAMGNAVGLVVELLREVLVEILQGAFLQDVGVETCHAVYAEGAYHCQACHVNLAILQDRQLTHQLLIVRVLGTYFIEEAAVDFVDNHVDTRQQLLKELPVPLLQCLRQNGVVGVCHGISGNIPGIIPFHAIIINEHAHQLGNCYSRMGIINLDADLVSKAVQVIMSLHVVAHDALHAGRYKEILLNQAQPLALVGAILRIEELSDLVDVVPVLLTLLDFLIGQGSIVREILSCLCIPQAQGIYGAVLVADNRHIIRHSSYLGIALMHSSRCTVIVDAHIRLTIKANLYGLVWLPELPGKAISQPVIRNLYLLVVDDLLLKEAVLVTDTATMSRQAQRSHGIHEAGCQTAKAAVAETCIRLLGIEIIQIKIQLLQHSLQSVLQIKVNQVGIQETPQQELNGEIINLLLVIFLILLICLNPVLGSILLNYLSKSLINLMLIQAGKLTAIVNLGSGHKTLLQFFLHFLNISFNY